MNKQIVVPDLPLLVVPIAIPGSGKSTLLHAASGIDGPSVIGADDLRVFTFGTRKTLGGDFIFKALLQLVHARMTLGLDVVYDCTNVKTSSRRALMSEVDIYTSYHFVALVSTVSFDVSVERNQQRPRHLRVPDTVMENMQIHLDDSRSALKLFDEGFDQIEFWNEQIDGLEFIREPK